MIPLKTNMRFQGFPWATFMFISLNIFAYICEEALRINGTASLITQEYNFVPAKLLMAITTGYPTMVANQVISMFLSMFLHANFMHILLNLSLFFTIGPALEARLGKVRYIVFYMLSGIISELVFAAANMTATGSVVGASGAIAGIQGAVLILWPKARITVVAPFSIFTTNSANMMLSFIIMQAAGVFFSMHSSSLGASMEVAYWEHIGGLTFGITVALFMRWSESRSGSPDRSVVVEPSKPELFDHVVDWVVQAFRRVGLVAQPPVYEHKTTERL